MKIIITVLIIAAMIFGYMRYQCVGIFGKVWTFYSDMQGNDFEKVECKSIFNKVI